MTVFQKKYLDSKEIIFHTFYTEWRIPRIRGLSNGVPFKCHGSKDLDWEVVKGKKLKNEGKNITILKYKKVKSLHVLENIAHQKVPLN